jgi:hypothetical protein
MHNWLFFSVDSSVPPCLSGCFFSTRPAHALDCEENQKFISERAQLISFGAFDCWTEDWLTCEAAGLRRRSLSSGGREATTLWTRSLPRRPRTGRRRAPADGSGSLTLTLGTNSSPRGRPGGGRRAFTHLRTSSIQLAAHFLDFSQQTTRSDQTFHGF